MDLLDYINVSVSDKGKSEILSKFGEYTPDSIKKYLIEEKGASPEKADVAVKEVKKAVQTPFDFKKSIPWVIGGIAGLFFLRALGRKKRR